MAGVHNRPFLQSKLFFLHGEIMSEEPVHILKEGEIDPEFNKMIRTLIIQEDDYFVYIDNNLEIQWKHDKNDNDIGRDFGLVLNKVAILESASRFIVDKKSMAHIKIQIAEGLARYIKYNNIKFSKEIHDSVSKEISELNMKTSWGWYFGSSLLASCTFYVMLIILWSCREYFRGRIGFVAVDVLFGAFSGAIGAMVSVVFRSTKLVFNANIDKKIHFMEGIGRVVAGVSGGLLTSLLFKSGFIFIGSSVLKNEMAFMLSLSIVAGASERLVPNLIGKLENKVKV